MTADTMAPVIRLPLPTPKPPAEGAGEGEMRRVPGLTYRRLDYWTRSGYLIADVATPGSGHRRIWPLEEMGVARAMVRLVDCGFTVPCAAEIARQNRITESWVDVPLHTGAVLRLTPDLWAPGPDEIDEEPDAPPPDGSTPGPAAEGP